MKQIKNGMFVLIVSYAALWISQILSYHWHTAVISEKTFRVIWGIIYPGYILGWLPKLLVFFAVGFLVTWFARARYAYMWAVVSGLTASFLFFFFRSPRIVSSETWVGWVYGNGDYLLYPLAAFCGSLTYITIKTWMKNRLKS